MVAAGDGTFVGSAGTDVLRVGTDTLLAGATFSGIERLEASGENWGVHISATQLSAFATIAELSGGPALRFEMIGGGSATMNLDRSITSLWIQGSAAHETLTLAASSTATFFYQGGDGDASIIARGAADTLGGGYGADTLRGGGGNDVITGYEIGGWETHDD